MNFLYPENLGNANILKEQSKPMTKIAMLRYENIFDFYSEEPFTVDVRKNEQDDAEVYEQILRIRVWNKEEQSFSWVIYADDRHQIEHIIIRKVTWDMDIDKESVKLYAKANREKLSSSWPTIFTLNKYLDKLDAKEIIDMISDLDLLLENGVMLFKSENPTWEWRDIELLRLFDWGQIHNTWSTHRKNEDLEYKIKKLISELEKTIEKNHKAIYFIGLNYSFHLESYKNALVE